MTTDTYNTVDSYIETYTGKRFFFLEPSIDDIDIVDIAHSLSMQCRFTGHTKEFYSIAEHSVIVCDMLAPEYKLWGLLHDASEAYLTDVASPVKPFLQNYKMMERTIMNCICDKFGLQTSMPEQVHYADMEALYIEAYHCMETRGKDWKINEGKELVEPKIKPLCLPPTKAKQLFLDTFYELTHDKK